MVCVCYTLCVKQYERAHKQMVGQRSDGVKESPKLYIK